MGSPLRKLELGQTIGILANLGVLVGILLLVYELGQNRKMMEVQARSDIANTLVNIQLQAATSPELEAASVKADSGAPMTALESEQVADLESAFWTYRANVTYLYQQGLYEEGEYLAQKERWRRFLNRNAATRAHWCSRREQQPPEFAAEIDQLLERPCE